MSDPSLAIQGAQYTALTADATLATLMDGAVRVYDIVPAMPTFPYISIGDDQILDNGNSCEPDIFELFSTSHVWSRQNTPAVGRTQAKRIAERVRDILKNLSTVTGFKVDGAHLERLDHIRDQDGLTAHSILVMRYLLATTA
ncbi:MAG: DUF3168 domain-containing protein [Anaerolineaceae bacterium]|nr:MAG: DUF3168 domain-containing protein [Anaerolineaceae bacterium]